MQSPASNDAYHVYDVYGGSSAATADNSSNDNLKPGARLYWRAVDESIKLWFASFAASKTDEAKVLVIKYSVENISLGFCKY